MESLSKKDEAALRRVVPQFVPTLAETMQQSIDMMEEKCRSETRKLYEDEGKADTLGPAGVPDALQEWLTKCRLGILGDEGHRDKSRRRLRAQVEKIELLLAKEPVPSNPNVLGAGAAMVEESSVRSLKAANKFIKTCEKTFHSRLDVWTAAKAKHQSLLRPQMGRPDAKKELDELTRKECERSEEVLQAIQKVREDIIQGQIQHAQLFVSTIVEQTSSALGLIDTLVLIDDLGYLPGDELIEKKRKSLKRLRKLQRAKGDEVGEGGDVQDCYEKPDGRHCSVRTWPVLPIQQLTQLFEKHNVPITDNNANESTPTPRPDNAADDVEGQTEDGAHVEAGGGGEGERKVTDWISGLIEEFGQEGPNSVVTTAHRQVIRSRDSNWERFLNDLDEKFTRLDAHFGKLQHEEVAWKETWLGHIKNLVRDNQFADGS
jgi:hypothetical protein